MASNKVRTEMFERKTLAAALVACTLAAAGTAGAAPYTEIGDAGDLPATAQATTGSPLTTISGELQSNGGSGGDVDMFRIHIPDPSAFGLQVELLDPGFFDSMIWVFDLAGNLVAGNDDGGSYCRYCSALGGFAGAAGDYFVAISDAANSPVGNPITGWNGDLFTVEFGRYVIHLDNVTGIASVPEPGTLALLGLGLGAAGWLRRRQG